MATNAEVRVRIATEGADRVRRALQGTTQAVRRAERDTQRTRERTSRLERETTRRGAQEVERAERKKRDEVRRTAQETQRHLRAEARERERVTRDARRRRPDSGLGSGNIIGGSSGLRSIAAGAGVSLAAGGVLGGVGTAISTLVAQLERVSSAIAGARGFQDTGRRAVTGQEFQVEAVRLGAEVFADLDPAERAREVAALVDEINRVAEATGQEPGELLRSLREVQTSFAAFEFGRRNLRAFGDEATRVGGQVADIANASANLNAQFRTGDRELDAGQSLDIIAQAGLRGSVDPRNLSGSFAKFAGFFRSTVDPNRSADPEVLLRQFVAMANAISSAQPNDPDLSATQLRGLSAALVNRRATDKLRLATGGRGRAGGRIRGGVDIEAFRDEGGDIHEAVGDVRAASALNTLIALERSNDSNAANPFADNVATMRELQNVSAAEGAAFRRTSTAEVQGTDFFEATQTGVRTQVNGIEDIDRRRQGNAANDVSAALSSRGALGEALADVPLVPQLLGAAVRGGYGSRIVEGLSAARQTGQVAQGLGGAVGGIAGGFTELVSIFERVVSEIDQQRTTAAAGGKTALEPGKVVIEQQQLARIEDAVARGARRGVEAGQTDDRGNSGAPSARGR